MKTYGLRFALAAGFLMVNTVHADDCVKTLMGNQCAVHEKGTSAHMRGNAVENAKASRELIEARRKAEATALRVTQSGAKKQR